jgi:hypothetical protein
LQAQPLIYPAFLTILLSVFLHEVRCIFIHTLYDETVELIIISTKGGSMATIIGLFDNAVDADAAVLDLQDRGYEPKDISVVVKDNVQIQAKRGSKGGRVASGVTSGAVAGAAVAGLAGLLVGIGALTIPGIGAFFIGGPLAAALGLTGAAATTVSAATTGAVAGGLIGALTAVGLPEDVARFYESRIREGAILVAVPTHSSMDTVDVRRIFNEYNADQVQVVS